MKGETLKLKREWSVGECIGAGGMAGVWQVTSGDQEAAAKLIPKAPGADRELLFVDVTARNVVPVIDRGEHGDYWVIVMPRASMSLRERLADGNAPLSLQDALRVLGDVAAALVDLGDEVVHRDLKPENVLLLDGTWQVADFGISRYAEAATATETRKFALTRPYAAPEQWRGERATAATDVYAFGVMAYELFAGARPFAGPEPHDYREQHLHQTPPPLADVPAALDALVAECLYKAPAARPRAANVVARLDAAASRTAASSGLAKLAQVNRDEVHRQSAAAAQVSAAQTAAEERSALQQAANDLWARITAALGSAIEQAAPSATLTPRGTGFVCSLGLAELTASPASSVVPLAGAPFEIVASARLILSANSSRYAGRQHSIWYCDARVAGEYAWFETAFMSNPFLSQRHPHEPYALNPSAESVLALAPAMHTVRVAWPFTRLDLGDLGDFIDRWATWLAEAAQGRLQHPTSLPERSPTGSWRRS
jgi:serine/threonine protein kinase